jgi:predicted anti-sigma-YlaC factor YlaD
MKCRKAEKRILSDLEGRLEESRRPELEAHLEGCPSCRKLRRDYSLILGVLRNGKEEEPLPSFWERLRPGLREEKKVLPLLVMERWCFRAIPVFLVTVFLVTGLALMTPAGDDTLSRSEVLLLENRNPLSESRTILEAEKPETSNMMLLFASLEEKQAPRRPRP